ncbi:asparaginase [Leucobacter albus]|uniref:Asparaginase n=1 Tax=Leucobacter albus TaxID=272210 RepID=A0ABW3TK21_9MICO
MSPTLPNVVLFTLGGTIASIPTAPGQAAVPTLDASDLVAGIPGLAEHAKVRAVTYSQHASGDLTFRAIFDLASAIRSELLSGATGVVVSQGTDTLEESAYLLDLLLDVDEPVVLTGAMRNPGLAGADGPANLLAAVHVAASPQARGYGPLVVFADQIHLARYVRKTHSSFVDTFRSPNLGPVGWVTEGVVHLPLLPRERTRPVQVNGVDVDSLPEVALITVGMDDDLRVLEDLDARGYSAVVVEAMGGGHLPSWDVARLANLAARMPVVFVSRTGAGQVYSATYGFPGAEKDLLRHGLTSGGVLDGVKARVLLRLLLAAGASRAELSHRFATEAM